MRGCAWALDGPAPPSASRGEWMPQTRPLPCGRYNPGVAVRKKLQRVGKSRCVLLDLDLLEALLPDGDLEQTLLVEVVGDALVIRRETSSPLPIEAVAAAVAP